MQPERTPTNRDILRVWHADRIVSASTARQYLYWIGRFRRYCNALGLDEADDVTFRRNGAGRFRRNGATGNE
jgi:hypothetical protein